MAKRIVWMSLSFGMVLLMGCQRITPVERVHAQPHRNWLTATVHLQGTVGDRAPLLQGQLYELQDATGSIWVLSPHENLQTGDRVLIKGQVRYQAIELAGQDRGEVYIEEQQQLDPGNE